MSETRNKSAGLAREVGRRLWEVKRKAWELAEIRRQYGEEVAIVGEGTAECPYIIIRGRRPCKD